MPSGKNKLEKHFSKMLKADSRFWGMKLHNNPLAHQTTPADYVLTCLKNDRLKVLLVEAKQVTCKDGKGRFAFKRLTQLASLMSFVNHPGHEAYLCLAYYDKNWANSEVYYVPILHMKLVMEAHSFVSLNRSDAADILEKFRCYNLDLLYR